MNHRGRLPVLLFSVGSAVLLALSSLVWTGSVLRHALDRVPGFDERVWAAPADSGPPPGDILPGAAWLPPARWVQLEPSMLDGVMAMRLSVTVSPVQTDVASRLRLEVGDPVAILELATVSFSGTDRLRGWIGGQESSVARAGNFEAPEPGGHVTIVMDARPGRLRVRAGADAATMKLPADWKLDRLRLAAPDGGLNVHRCSLRSEAFSAGEAVSRTWQDPFESPVRLPDAQSQLILSLLAMTGMLWLLARVALDTAAVARQPIGGASATGPSLVHLLMLRLALIHSAGALVPVLLAPDPANDRMSWGLLLAGIGVLIVGHALWLILHRDVLLRQGAPRTRFVRWLEPDLREADFRGAARVIVLLAALVVTWRSGFDVPRLYQNLMLALVLHLAILPHVPSTIGRWRWPAGEWSFRCRPLILVPVVAVCLTHPAPLTGLKWMVGCAAFLGLSELFLLAVATTQVASFKVFRAGSVVLLLLAAESYYKGCEGRWELLGDEVPFDPSRAPALLAHTLETAALTEDHDELRILCLGGSATWGAYLRDGERAYPALLEEILNARPEARRTRVFNCGVPGYSSEMGMPLLEDHLLALEPDLVIVAYGAADRPYRSRGPGPHRRQVRYRLWLEDYPLLLRGWQALRASGCFLALRRTFNDMRSTGSLGRPPPPVTFEEMLENAEGFMALARQHRFALAFSYDVPASAVPRLCQEPTRVDEDLSHLDALRWMARERGVPLLEWTRVFCAPGTRNDLLYFDGVHLRAEGHQLLAEELARQLVEGGLVP